MTASPVELGSIVRTAALKAGCSNQTGLDAEVTDACRRGDSPIEAVCEGGYFEDEDCFFQELAHSLAMNFEPESAMDLGEPLHGKFPAKLALLHRVLPHRLSEDRVELMTYDPFNLEAKQAVAQECWRKSRMKKRR